MKKKMYQNVVANHLREHSSIYVFVIVLFLMGVIFGAIVVNSLSISQKEDLFQYLSQFFLQLKEGKITESNDLFFQSFFHNTKFLWLMWILGISVIGLPIILVLLFIKGLVVGFTVGFLVNQMKWNGFLLSFVAVLPQNLIIIPIFIMGCVLSISFSIKMIQRQLMKQMTQPFSVLFGRYTFIFLMVTVFLGVAASIEAFISPHLMEAVIQTIFMNPINILK